MRESLFETVVGLVVVAVAAVFLTFSLNQRAGASASGGYYELNTVFRDAGGIGPGTDVILSGVKVGSITKVELKQDSLMAKVSFSMRNDVKLPKEYKAQLQTDSLLGSAHLGFTYVGGEDGDSGQFWKAGEEVENVGGVGNIMSVISSVLGGQNAANNAPAPAATGSPQ
jgi:phospholipid/cholesterol/gamma-HCH transport system substrate-binding protein